MKFVTIVRCNGTEMNDDCHAIEADAIGHAEQLVARLEPAYSIAVIACTMVTNVQYGSAIFYQAGIGADLY